MMRRKVGRIFIFVPFRKTSPSEKTCSKGNRLLKSPTAAPHCGQKCATGECSVTHRWHTGRESGSSIAAVTVRSQGSGVFGPENSQRRNRYTMAMASPNRARSTSNCSRVRGFIANPLNQNAAGVAKPNSSQGQQLPGLIGKQKAPSQTGRGLEIPGSFSCCSSRCRPQPHSRDGCSYRIEPCRRSARRASNRGPCRHSGRR